MGFGDLLGGFGGMIGGFIGDQNAQGDDAQQQQMLEEAAKVRMQAANGGPSAYNTMDPTGRNSELETLAQLRDVSRQGWQPQDEAAMNHALTAAGTADRGARDALVNRFQSQGMGGGGNELMAQLMSQQNQYDKANQSGTDIAAAGRARALQALRESGALAGQVRTGDLQTAGGKDAMSRFNALNQQQANEWNANNEVSGYNARAKNFGDYAQRSRNRGSQYGQQAGYTMGMPMDMANQYGQQGMQDASSMMSSGGGGGGGGGGGAMSMLAALGHGGVVDKPTLTLTGESGREAVIPINQKGKPDMARATNPAVRRVLSQLRRAS